MTEEDRVLVERHGAVLVATIDRPEALNALNAGVLTGLGRVMDEVAAAPDVRAVVITGSGDKAFCAGADLKELDGISVEDARRTVERGQRVFRSVELSPVPVIAAVNGLALGGGFELVLACTFPVLATHARLALPESGLGLVPGYGGTQRLPRVVGPKVAAHLMLTGHRLDAARAAELGLTPVPPVPVDQLMDAALTLANTIAAQGPQAVRSIRAAMSAALDGPLEVGLGLEASLSALALAGSESQEGVAAFLGRRQPCFPDVVSARGER